MEEKTLYEFLIGVDEETLIGVNIYINGSYRLVLMNKAKDLLWCLSKGMLNTNFYLHTSSTLTDGLEIIEIYIQELA